ncbi:uncharacterized protein RJT21DRAFT_120607 [Scheffersomyces amazonensis]|uniref:uncharacterized protein n=1 Tax=Scheffersomyces amazonensis TaxID=1078765 RepID=UPI00315D3716
MDSSLSFSSGSFTSNRVIEDTYKLALKLFMNKNFDKSYSIINKLYQDSTIEYSKGLISERLFIKIIILYLTQIGLALGKRTSFRLSQIENNRVINLIIQDTLLNQFKQSFGGDIINIPLEIIYNYVLLFITNREVLLVNDKSFLAKIRTIYGTANLKTNDHNEDKYLKRLNDLYVFEVLPTFDEFEESQHVIQSNPIYSDDINENLKKLRQIQQNKCEIIEQEKQRELERKRLEHEAKQLEVEKQKEREKQSNLKYKSIKEIQKQYSPSSSIEQKLVNDNDNENKDLSQLNQLNQIKSRLFYTYRLIKDYIKENSPIILIIIVLLFIINKFLNLKQIKLKDRLLETIRMAFKVSFL